MSTDKKKAPAEATADAFGTSTHPLEKQIESILPRFVSYYEAKAALRGGRWVWGGSQFLVVPAEAGGCPSCVCGCDVMSTPTRIVAEAYGADFRAVDRAHRTREAAQKRTPEQSPYRAPESAR